MAHVLHIRDAMRLREPRFDEMNEPEGLHLSNVADHPEILELVPDAPLTKQDFIDDMNQRLDEEDPWGVQLIDLYDDPSLLAMMSCIPRNIVEHIADDVEHMRLIVCAHQGPNGFRLSIQKIVDDQETDTFNVRLEDADIDALEDFILENGIQCGDVMGKSVTLIPRNKVGVSKSLA